MEFGTMLKLCKKRKYIDVRYFGSQKFLTDGCAAAYMGEYAPEWTAEDCVISLGLDEEAQGKYHIMNGSPNEKELDVGNYLPANRLKYSINANGDPLQPFTLGDGRVFFVNMEYPRRTNEY